MAMRGAVVRLVSGQLERIKATWEVGAGGLQEEGQGQRKERVWIWATGPLACLMLKQTARTAASHSERRENLVVLYKLGRWEAEQPLEGDSSCTGWRGSANGYSSGRKRKSRTRFKA